MSELLRANCEERSLGHADRERAARAPVGEGLRESRDYTRAIVEALQHGFVVSIDGEIVEINDELCQMTGFTREELLGSHYPYPFLPTQLGEAETARDALKQGRLEVELSLQRKDGTSLPVLVRAGEAAIPGHDAIGSVATFHDLTERRHYEDALRRERDYAQAVISSMHEGFVLTRGGRIEDVNDAFCALMGLPRATLIGMAAPFPLQHANAELELMRGDGSIFTAAVTVSAVRLDDGSAAGHVSTVRDVTPQKRMLGELEALARRDELTGMINARGFRERLAAEVARATRHDRPLTLVLFDIDHFKAINDTHGHAVGDAVLRELGDRLRPLARAGEEIARVGGEEFAWLLSDTNAGDGYAAAERVRHAVTELPFPEAGAVTVSAGVAELTDADGDLYKAADRMLYEAKLGGRDRTCVAVLAA